MYTVYTVHTVYPQYMSDTESIGTRDARAELGRLVDAAHFQGRHTILTKSDEPRAVLVPYEWWERQTTTPTDQPD